MTIAVIGVSVPQLQRLRPLDDSNSSKRNLPSLAITLTLQMNDLLVALFMLHAQSMNLACELLLLVHAADIFAERLAIAEYTSLTSRRRQLHSEKNLYKLKLNPSDYLILCMVIATLVQKWIIHSALSCVTVFCSSFFTCVWTFWLGCISTQDLDYST